MVQRSHLLVAKDTQAQNASYVMLVTDTLVHFVEARDPTYS